MLKDLYEDFKIAVWSAIAVVALILIFNLCGTNTYDAYVIRQAPVSGTMSVIDEPGFYWDGFADISKYEVSDDMDFSEEITLSDGSKMGFTGSVKYRMPRSEVQRLLIHKDFGSYRDARENLIRKNIRDALSNIAPMFTAQDTYGARKPEIKALAETYLQNGAFKTTSTLVRNADGTSTRVAQVERGENGEPIVVKRSLLSVYGVEVQQLVMGDPVPDSKVAALIATQKEAEQQAVVAKSVAERAKQDALTAEAEGKAKVAEEEAKAKALAIVQTTEAAKNRDVAKLDAEKAQYEAQKIKAEGEAQARVNALKVQAGLTPLEKAQIDKETAIGVAAELAKVKFPETMIISGGGNGGSVNPFDAVGLKALYGLSQEMTASK